MKETYYKRSAKLEDDAVDRIADLFTTSWETTQNMSPRKIMSVVLQKIKNACLGSATTATEEHLRLLRANQYFQKYIDILDSDGPLPIDIAGNDMQSCLNNLATIKKTAASEEFAKDIRARIDLFVRKINKKIEALEEERAARVRQRRTAVRLAVCGVIVVSIFIAWINGQRLFYNYSLFDSIYDNVDSLILGAVFYLLTFLIR